MQLRVKGPDGTQKWGYDLGKNMDDIGGVWDEEWPSTGVTAYKTKTVAGIVSNGCHRPDRERVILGYEKSSLKPYTYPDFTGERGVCQYMYQHWMNISGNIMNGDQHKWWVFKKVDCSPNLRATAARDFTWTDLAGHVGYGVKEGLKIVAKEVIQVTKTVVTEVVRTAVDVIDEVFVRPFWEQHRGLLVTAGSVGGLVVLTLLTTRFLFWVLARRREIRGRERAQR